MYYTLTMIDGHPELVDHPTLDEAETFAREVAQEGEDCTVLQVLSVVPGEYVAPVSLEKLYGLEPGRDFPATL